MATNTTFFNARFSGNVPLTLSSQPLPTVVATIVNSGILSFQNTNSSTSTIVVNSGTFVLGGAGTLGSIASITVNTTGAFAIDNSSTNNPNRVNDSANVTLNGGTFNFVGNVASSSETLQNLNLGAGTSTVNVFTSFNVGATLTFLSIGTRSTGALVNFNGGNLGATTGTFTQIVLVSPPTLTNGILPYALVNAPTLPRRRQWRCRLTGGQFRHDAADQRHGLGDRELHS